MFIMLIDDISDKVSVDDSFRLHAVMKLSEDQEVLTDRITELLMVQEAE